MNIAARKRANDELGDWIVNRLDELQTKGFSKNEAINKLGNKIDQWYAENDLINDRTESGERFAKKMGDNPGGLGTAPSNASDGTPVSEHFDQHGRRITTLGRDVNPFQIDARTLDLMSKSVKTGHASRLSWLRMV